MRQRSQFHGKVACFNSSVNLFAFLGGKMSQPPTVNY